MELDGEVDGGGVERCYDRESIFKQERERSKPSIESVPDERLFT